MTDKISAINTQEYKIRPTRAEIDLDNLIFNLRNIRNKAGDKAICAVVKADAYGHGIESIKAIVEEGVEYLAVAFIEEAIELRKNNINHPILILGPTFNNRIEDLVEYNLEPTVISYDFAKALSDYAVKNNTVHPVHIKIDTGMNRIGFKWDKALEEIREISKLPGIDLKGIFTHFATADEKDKNFSKIQLERFKQVIDELEKEGINIPIKHVENSAAIMEFDNDPFNMVRPGIILYGYYPSKDVEKTALEIKPVMNFITQVTQVKDLEIGEAVGYGRSFINDKKRRVATIPVGYADGYSRILSHKDTNVFVKGHRAPILGNICMDQSVIDVTDLEIEPEETVELFGQHLSGQELADKLGTIPYELTCMINKRVPRVYIKNNKVKELEN